MEEKLSLIVLDREKIQTNLFWKILIETIKEQQTITRLNCEREISAPLDKLRFYQGQLSAWALFFQLPDIILSDLSKEEHMKG